MRNEQNKKSCHGVKAAVVVASLLLIQNATAFSTVPMRAAPLMRRTTTTTTTTNLFSSAVSSMAKDEEDEKQVVRLMDPRTNREIILVGCMHYNPASIQLAEKTAVDAAKSLSQSPPSPPPSFLEKLMNQKKDNESVYSGGLAAVLVESCRTRWDAANEFRSETLKEAWQRDIYDKILPNEMRAAAKVANSNGIPVVLGDQEIEITGKRVKATLKQTLQDLLTPWNGGWDRIVKDVKVGFGVISNSFGINSTPEPVVTNAGKLTYRDFLDANLLLSMPVSLARYPLGILVRFPKFGFALLTFFSAIDYVSGQLMMGTLTSSDPMTQTIVTSFFGAGSAVVDDASPLSWLVTFLIAGLETIVFARVFMLPILAERDVVLAKSIVATCAATDSKRANLEAAELYRNILEDKDSISGQQMVGKRENNGAVVAILGAAHVNGVRDIILNGVENDPLLRL